MDSLKKLSAVVIKNYQMDGQTEPYKSILFLHLVLGPHPLSVSIVSNKIPMPIYQKMTGVEGTCSNSVP